MIEALISAFVGILSGGHLLYLLMGILLGIAVGIFPGLGGTAGMSLLLPFVYGMDPVSALAMMVGLLAVISTADTFTSVMMGVPGSAGAQATVVDGFPLAKKGQAARALSAAFSASLIGGLVGAIVLSGFVVIARPIVLAFGSAELFMLAMLGLSMVGVLSGTSMAKGMAGCGLGLLIGALGPAPATGEYRLNFGLDYLMDSLPIVVVALGIFAVPEIVDLVRKKEAIARTTALGHGWLQGLKDTLRYRWIVLRCSGLGCLIGAIPGLGGSVVDWIAYGHIVQTSRDRENFGKGDIRGVIAPESANNAKEGGALVPTLLFGIPGSGGTAVFLGGLILIGVQPGIRMIETQLDLVYTVIWSLALANIIGAGICVLIARPVAKITEIRYVYLAPFMIMIIFFAAFQSTRLWGDMMTMFALGVLATYMKRFGWPRPPLLIGYVLSGGAETYLYQAVQFYGWNWSERPLAIVMAVLIAVSVYFGLKFQRQEARAARDRIASSGIAPQIAFALLIAAVGLYAIYDTWYINMLGRVMPQGAAVATVVFSCVIALGLALKGSDSRIVYDEEAVFERRQETAASLEHYLLWIAGLLIGTAIFGFVVAVTGFFLLFLRIKAQAPWPRVLLLTACAVGFLAAMSWLLVLYFPTGILQRTFALPWPLG
ncbi:MAG: tripartite tricarboxylate transporter permease [Acetobacterales bacterium]